MLHIVIIIIFFIMIIIISFLEEIKQKCLYVVLVGHKLKISHSKVVCNC